ncbi:MAG: hypothetical protein P4M09_30695 [Devosia sp.]|nr:hypothetical protein [Devosia sp.]
MATQWTDLYMRKALDDNGSVPYTGGTWTNSPDIIPYGTTVVGNPTATFGGSNYGSDQGRSTVFEQQNYFYMRAKNLFNGAETGTLFLYYCPQNLFLFPSLWSKNQLATSSGKPSVDVSAAKLNDVVVVGEPFTYVPTNNIHSCLIGRLVTPKNPNPLPQDGDFPAMSDLATYIANHPNMAWRNVVLVDADIPTFTNTFTIDTTPAAPGTSAQYLIGISFNKLTIGSQLAFSAGTPIPSGPDQGKVIQLTQTAVTQTDGSLGTSYLTIPAGYKTSVSFSYWAKTPVQKGWVVRFYAIQIVNSAHAARAFARPIHELGVGIGKDHPLLALGGGMEQGIRVGDVSLIGQ